MPAVDVLATLARICSNTDKLVKLIDELPE
jgi:hypothetical protein